MAGVPHYVTETQVLHRVARHPDCEWRFTDHVLDKMAINGWTADDVIHAVRTGRVVLEEQKKDRLWRVEGKDVDGGRIRVVLAVYETILRIKAVTAF